MRGWPITVLDEQGRRMWAFDTRTDPQKVLHAVTWAWASKPHERHRYIAPGTSLCGYSCPMVEGGYCLDCHGIAYAALEAARRYESYRRWLVTGELPQ